MPTMSFRWPRAALAFALALTFAGVSAADGSLAPPLAELAVAPQRMAPVVARFRTDLAALERVHDIDGGPRRDATLRALHAAWRARLAEIAPEGLGPEDRIDRFLFARELERRDRALDADRARRDATAGLLPGIDALVALAEARRALEYPEPRAAADTLARARDALADLRDGAAPAGATPAVALRAARRLDALREDLEAWYAFHAGYDPQFTWWAKHPWDALDAAMKTHAEWLREDVAGVVDTETIVGDPIGRDAIVAGLRDELIPYTPEQLMALAERELAWTRREMDAAAAAMGARDWRAALETVKARHPAPGDQPRLVVELADEAIAYLEANDLVTVPELARRDWRMTMLSPEYQLQAPFFLGGEDVWVAYPTDTMPHDKKMMALRGNNRHFSRAVVHHELIPGHHLQHFYTARHNVHRKLFGSPFWTEGWALYWEFRLYERGFAATPEDRMGMLFWRSHRAARILFSLGFHLGKMTPDEAVDLLVERVGHEPENARAEVRRSFAGDYGPLYQLAYMVGGLQFRALHAEVVGGGKMTERAFHDAILRGGPMPVAIVRARLLGLDPASGDVADWRFYDFTD